jgi:glucose/mannose-6-phosphate isomerase
MYRLTAGFPDQCREALRIAQGVSLPKVSPANAILTGMGGSAAGGDFAKAIFDAEGDIPFTVNRDYQLPSWARASTLVFATSYSGNTEETLSAYADAHREGAHRVVVTSGGKLAGLADEHQVPKIVIPGGMPPRTALGYMLIPVLYACENMGLIPAQPYNSAFDLLDQCVADWGVDVPQANNPAKQLAEDLHGAVSVLYGLGAWQGIVANRWKGQINENAKNMTFANAFPELNHNEILGWVKADGQGVEKWVAVVLEDGQESAKMQKRRDVTASLISTTAKTHRVSARGDSLLERMLSLVFFGDFVSLYLAALNGIDPENIDSINTLKSELAGVA